MATQPPFTEVQLEWLKAQNVLPRAPTLEAQDNTTGTGDSRADGLPVAKTPTGSTLDTHPSRQTLAKLPTFTPQQQGSGLDILAAAAVASTTTPPALPAGLLHSTYHVNRATSAYNPAALLPQRIVKRILNLEFVEMSEITLDDQLPHEQGKPPPARPAIQDISQWLERYSLMAGILASRFPDKAPELFAYQAIIIRAERNYQKGQWVAYDRQFRRTALARKDLNWSSTNSTFFNEAFTGRAQAIPRCQYCLQDDHTEAYCPRNPHRPVLGWFPDPCTWPSHPPAQTTTYNPNQTQFQKSSELCRRFNQGKCKKPGQKCRYTHACSACNGPHAASECSRGSSSFSGRSRSPSWLTPRVPPPMAPPRH